MSEQLSETARKENLEKIIKGAQAAFFVTQSPGGAMHARPMANAHVEANLSAIWFATQKNSGKIAELRQEQEVLLGYVNGSGSEWASVNGTASFVNDRAKIKELWSPIWKNWFDGPDDPNIRLIRVTPREAEYWDSGSRVITMLKLAVGAVTAKTMDYGDNQHMKL
ncbi:MAG TPA: pyridoxamine 5'-phosphate oxidase family protein [Tepidisphaeraceae bacterium]|jgi:general stress protein 26|nr:pyridoxamine 5'-phosphate oxidase family protein [Tepidisphaeraceae bacterium]